MHNKESQQLNKAGPRFFYGYVIVVVAFLILVVSFSVNVSFGLFFTPVLRELGWSRAMISGAYSLSMIIYGVLGIATGRLSDRFGPRLVITVCGFLVGGGCLLMSQVNSLWLLYLAYGVIIGTGLSGVWVPQMSLVARWFTRRRSLMTGIVVAGGGISQLVAPPLISRLIAGYDWRLSFVIMGGVVLVFMVVAAQFLRRDPAHMGQQAFGSTQEIQQVWHTQIKDFSFKESVYTSQFWITAMIFLSYGFGVSAIMVHIVPYAIDLKISAISAANILAVLGGTSIAGNYVLGGLADRIGNRAIFIIGSAMLTAALLLLIFTGEEWVLYLFAVIFGFAFGGMGAGESPLIAKLFGVGSLGLIYGVIHVGFTIGGGLGPFLSGYLFDITGTYQLSFIVCAALAVVCLAMALILRQNKRFNSRI